MDAVGSYTVSHPKTPREHHISRRDCTGYNWYTGLSQRLYWLQLIYRSLTEIVLATTDIQVSRRDCTGYNWYTGLSKRLYWLQFISLTHSWSWALLEKPPIVQPLKNFPAFYGTRRFITAFTRALHWSLFWAKSIQSPPSHSISVRSILILSTYLRLGLPSGLFPSGFPTNILYTFLFSSIRVTCNAHLILPDLIILIILGEEYKVWSFLLCWFLQPHITTHIQNRNKRAGAGMQTAVVKNAHMSKKMLTDQLFSE
jgi:hypothetical protein